MDKRYMSIRNNLILVSLDSLRAQLISTAFSPFFPHTLSLPSPDLCQGTQCVPGLLQERGADKGGPGQGRLAPFRGHWEVE